MYTRLPQRTWNSESCSQRHKDQHLQEAWPLDALQKIIVKRDNSAGRAVRWVVKLDVFTVTIGKGNKWPNFVALSSLPSKLNVHLTRVSEPRRLLIMSITTVLSTRYDSHAYLRGAELLKAATQSSWNVRLLHRGRSHDEAGRVSWATAQGPPDSRLQDLFCRRPAPATLAILHMCLPFHSYKGLVVGFFQQAGIVTFFDIMMARQKILLFWSLPSMVVASLTALPQNTMDRLLAWNPIAHVSGLVVF